MADLTDLIAAEIKKFLINRFWGISTSETEVRAFGSDQINVTELADVLALVVEQHTNGRIAELYEQRDNAIEAGFRLFDRAEKAEATIAGVRAVEADYLDPEDTDIECREDVWRFIRDLRAALEGVGDADPT